MFLKKLDPEDFTFGVESIAAPAWSNYSSSLTIFWGSSLQSGSEYKNYQHYIDVYHLNPDSSSFSEPQFSIAYGDSKGSGSLSYFIIPKGFTPSRTVYGQFVNLLLGEDENTSFNFSESSNSENFYAIVINRARYKQNIMPGSIQINGLVNNVSITDNSLITSSVDYTNAGRRYTLGSGSFGDGVMPPSVTTGVYGYVYPDVGIIILNPASLNNVNTSRTSPNANNPDRLRRSLTRFALQSQETVSSNYIFCRAQNHEFNFSTQQNFISSTRNITGSNDTTLNDFIQTPPTYITTVGLYNNNNELLAVAKLSKPLKKDFNTEALIRVKLDF